MGNAVTKLLSNGSKLKEMFANSRDAFSVCNGNDISGMAFTIIALIVIAPEFPVYIYFRAFSARGLKVPTRLLKWPRTRSLHSYSFPRSDNCKAENSPEATEK